MKNVFTLLILFAALSLPAQTKLTKGGAFKGLNEQSDSIVASQTVNYTLELGNDVYGVMNLALESDEVSGTSAYTAYLQRSLNGEDWANVDTVTHTGGGDSYNEFSTANATYTYWRVNITATAAAQKSNLKIWGRLNEGFVLAE